MPKLKGALIGFGQVAEKAHAPPLLQSSGLEIVAVVESFRERAALAQKTFPDARVYGTLEELFAGEPSLDFVDIATPPYLHGRQALAALKRGCHVLCEKPLTLDPAEFATLVGESEKSDRALFTVHNWAYSPQWLKIFSIIDSGTLGRLKRAELEVLRTQPATSAVPGDWRRDLKLAGGGILVDHGWHNLYLLHRLFGAAPSKVSLERCETPGPGAAEEEVSVSFDFPYAASARLHMTWRAKTRSNSARILGERGLLVLGEDGVSLTTTDGITGHWDFDEPLSQGSAHPGWFAAMLPDFRAAVEDRRERARGLAEAAFCVDTISRAYQSPVTA